MTQQEASKIEKEPEQGKSVADRIIDMFAKDIKGEPLFKDMADKLILEMQEKKPSKKKIGEILADEDQKS